jgi:mono/diheme cytochrome c family protein
LILGRICQLTILGRSLAVLSLALISVYGLADSGAEFNMRCAPCHGAKGAGETKLGQNLRVRDLGSADVQQQSDAELREIITKGRGKMPAYGGKLSKEQIDGIVKWIRTLKK